MYLEIYGIYRSQTQIFPQASLLREKVNVSAASLWKHTLFEMPQSLQHCEVN